MRLLYWLPLIALYPLVCSAHEKARKAAGPDSDWRKFLLSCYAFQKKPQGIPISTPTVAEVPQNADPAIVLLPPYRVVVRNEFERLHSTIAANEARVASEARLARWGIGVHEHVGRKVTAYYGTVFFVPVFAGLSW